MEKNTVEIQVKRVYRLPNNHPLKAFADIAINNALLVKSIRVVEGKSGLFVSMPQEMSKDKKWYESVRCLTPEIRQRIQDEVLAAYGENASDT